MGVVGYKFVAHNKLNDFFYEYELDCLKIYKSCIIIIGDEKKNNTIYKLWNDLLLLLNWKFGWNVLY